MADVVEMLSLTILSWHSFTYSVCMFVFIEYATSAGHYKNMYNITNICKAHIVSIRAESEAPIHRNEKKRHKTLRKEAYTWQPHQPSYSDGCNYDSIQFDTIFRQRKLKSVALASDDIIF